MHLQCVFKSCKEIVAKNNNSENKKDKEYNFTCLGCKGNMKFHSKELNYNCYCKRYIEEEKLEINFDPIFIPHGCGALCDESICIHKNCSLPCHPGPHEICLKKVSMKCPCGKVVKEYSCGQEKQEAPCGNECNKKLACGKHLCDQKCHEGSCLCKICQIELKVQPTTNISLKKMLNKFGPKLEKNKNVVYCGRRVSGAWNLNNSIWGNPFKLNHYNNNLDLVLKKYENYARNNPKIMNHLHLLVGKTLACWCKPDGCHTDILISLMKEKKLIE
jgi:hypothetical protein